MSELITLPELRGAQGAVRVVLRGAPVRRARDGRLKAVETVGVDDGEGGGEELETTFFLSIRAMFACGSYVMKLKEYLPRVIYQCRDCQQDLGQDPGAPHIFEFEARALDVPPFQVRLEAPAVECPRCGQPNVLWTDAIRDDIERACANALAALPDCDRAGD